MRGNIPIPDLPLDEEVWLMVAIQSARQGRTRQGKPYYDAVAQNSSGRITLKIWQEVFDESHPVKPGLWGIQGKKSVYQDQVQFVVSRYRPITVDQYREHQTSDPPWPRAYTLDIETLALPEFRKRVPSLLKRDLRLGKMKIEQLERYAEDPEAEAERVYMLGSLSATTGRVISIAVQIGPVAGFSSDRPTFSELVFGIDETGREEPERDALERFMRVLANFDRETDEIVGHNVLDFDLPFLFQRCLVQGVPVPPLVNLGEYNVKGVYDTMRQWWFGAKRHVSLDDIAWALNLQSSKTDEVEGSRVFDLYYAGRLDAIREYNLNDVRLTRKVYEHLVSVLGR